MNHDLSMKIQLLLNQSAADGWRNIDQKLFFGSLTGGKVLSVNIPITRCIIALDNASEENHFNSIFKDLKTYGIVSDVVMQEEVLTAEYTDDESLIHGFIDILQSCYGEKVIMGTHIDHYESTKQRDLLIKYILSKRNDLGQDRNDLMLNIGTLEGVEDERSDIKYFDEEDDCDRIDYFKTIKMLDDEGFLNIISCEYKDTLLSKIHVSLNQEITKPQRELKVSKKTTGNPIMQLPADTTWEQLTFQLLDADLIAVSYRDEQKQYSFDQLGFAKTLGPAKFFKGILYGVKISTVTSNEYTQPTSLKKSTSTNLRNAFGIQVDPFEKLYRTKNRSGEQKTYKPKFCVLPPSVQDHASHFLENGEASGVMEGYADQITVKGGESTFEKDEF